MNIVTAVDSDPRFNTDASDSSRGISGHSMGGYGAIRIALRNPGVFGSVSVFAGPLSFWGTRTSPPHTDTTYTGIEELLPAILHEAHYDSVLAINPAGDATAYQQLMYPSASRRLSSMMFAMAAAFSPTGLAGPGATTIMAYGVNLPIGLDGQIDPATWNFWMANDPVAMLMGGAAANLVGVKVYLDAGAQDDLGLNGAHAVFAGALAQAGMPADVNITHTAIADAGGGTVPASHTTQTFERIKLLLKWHSEQF
jgi:S-formylglutathione hydrolase FrmB